MIDSQSFKRIQSFQTGKKQIMVKGDRNSSWHNFTSGAIKNSVGGPIVFIMFIDCIPDTYIGTFKLFANESKLWGGSIKRGIGFLKTSISNLTWKISASSYIFEKKILKKNTKRKWLIGLWIRHEQNH